MHSPVGKITLNLRGLCSGVPVMGLPPKVEEGGAVFQSSPLLEARPLSLCHPTDAVLGTHIQADVPLLSQGPIFTTSWPTTAYCLPLGAERLVGMTERCSKESRSVTGLELRLDPQWSSLEPSGICHCGALDGRVLAGGERRC